MKNLILILGILISIAAAQAVFAQQEGTINYDTKVNLHKTLPPDRADMKEMIPEFNIHKSKLSFRGSESLYINIDEDDEEEFGEEGGPVHVRMRRPMNEYYYNQASGKRTTVQELLGKYFLIEDSIKILPWKITGEMKTILGYDCKKATLFLEDRKQNIVAWYSDKLESYLGPEIFRGLPGAILEVDINEGERLIIATKISNEKLGKGELKVPTKGEKTTQEEFRKIMEEQRKRMGGNGNVIIRH